MRNRLMIATLAMAGVIGPAGFAFAQPSPQSTPQGATIQFLPPAPVVEQAPPAPSHFPPCTKHRKDACTES